MTKVKIIATKNQKQLLWRVGLLSCQQQKLLARSFRICCYENVRSSNYGDIKIVAMVTVRKVIYHNKLRSMLKDIDSSEEFLVEIVRINKFLSPHQKLYLSV